MSRPSSSHPDGAVAHVQRADLPAVFKARESDTNKGSFGTLAILGGGPGMSGAALLAGRAGLRLGAGKVLVGFVDSQLPMPCDPCQPELMLRIATVLLREAHSISTWVAGCGMGDVWASAERLQHLFDVRGDSPMVLDADALNLLARHAVAPDWGSAPVVLTPHPGEAGRLLASSASEVQSDRLGAARELASRYRAWIVLKGAHTVVCDPAGVATINPTGNAGLATAGTGDVLAGMLGALIAQKLPMPQAVRGAVWLHGAAAQALAAEGVGPIGLTANEVIDAARRLRNS
jgi:ADP-dependent NAD(P)H-hydrate dehydratase